MKSHVVSTILFVLIIFCLIGFASASENVTEIEMIGNSPSIDFEESLVSQESISVDDYDMGIGSENMYESFILDESSSNTQNSLRSSGSNSFYFNSSKETSGDGSSWENANNNATAWTDVSYDGCNIYLAEGDYIQNSSFSYTNAIIIGQGRTTRISFFGDSSHYGDTRHYEYTFINLTFTKSINPNDNSVRVINLYQDFNFIDCTFVDVSMVRKGWSGGSASLITTFENCEFLNINKTHFITNNQWGILKFNNCTFDNITADSIVYNNDYISYSNITNSVFKNCDVKGILFVPFNQAEYVISNCSYDFDVNRTPPFKKPDYVNTTDYSGTPTIYINITKQLNGDGSSWENATNDFNRYMFFNGLCICLAEGEYDIPWSHDNVLIIGLGEKTIIKSFSYQQMANYRNSNRCVTVVNCTFDCRLKMEGLDFKFVNCSFKNSTFVLGEYQRSYPNRDTISDVCSATFENCKFGDYNGTFLVNNFEFSKFIFNNCNFDNIRCDAIVDSYGGQTDNFGRVDGVYICNSSFSNCDIEGIVKARQVSFCTISKCIYDFPVNNEVPLVGPFYINTTDRPVIRTNLGVAANGNSLVITLTDGSNNPLVDYEIEVVTNGRVSYEYTDNKGKIVLSNLLGNYSFEIFYPGDEYEGYVPCRVFKNFTFVKSKLGTVLSAPQVSANYNVAKSLVVALKDSNGKVLANRKVTVKVGSISKVLTTNKNGQASLNVATLVPKTYTVKVSFNEDEDYKGSSLSVKVVVSKGVTKLVAKAKTFKLKTKTKKFYVTLKDSKNRVLKGKKLTIKVNGKTYSATTNKKGVAVFKIIKLSKKGTFKSKIAFKGDKWYKAISKTVKIKVK